MAITQNVYTGDGSTVLFTFSWPYLNRQDINVKVDDIEQTVIQDYTLESDQTVRFVNAPADQSRIVIFRVTNTEDLEHVFYPGSAIRAKDLNTDFTQSLFVNQETQNISYEASDIGYLYPPELGGEYSNVQDALTDALTSSGGGGGEGSVTSVNGKIGIVNLGITDLTDVAVGSKTGPPTQLCYEGASPFVIRVLANGVSQPSETPQLLKIDSITFDSTVACPTGGSRDFYNINWVDTLGSPGSTKLQFGGPCGDTVYTWVQEWVGDSTCFTSGPTPTVNDGDLLVYDSSTLKWISKPDSEIIPGDGIDTSVDLSNNDVTISVDLAGGDDGLELAGGKLKSTVATPFTLGSVKVGSGLDVDFDGTINSTFDPDSLEGAYLSLSPFVGPQTVLSTSPTEFTGKVLSESTTEFDAGNTLITKDYLESVNSSVSTGETPPLNPELGDLWWDSSNDSGRLYVYYIDGISGQWVEASPAGGGLFEYWQKDGDDLKPLNDTDNVIIGGGDIKLNADGSGRFLGNVISSASSANSSGLFSNGAIYAVRDGIGVASINGISSKGNYIFAGDDGTGSNSDQYNIYLFANGSAEFKGTLIAGEITSDNSTSYFRWREADGITVYDDDAVAETLVFRSFSNVGGALKQQIAFKADGSSEFAGTLITGGDPTNGSNTGVRLGAGGSIINTTGNASGPILTGYTIGSSTKTVDIQGDGSATFAGNLKVGSTSTPYTNIQVNRSDDGYIFRGGKDSTFTSEINANGSATFANSIAAGSTISVNRGISDDSAAFYVENPTGIITRLNCDGSAAFGDINNTSYGVNIENNSTSNSTLILVNKNPQVGPLIRGINSGRETFYLLSDGSAYFEGGIVPSTVLFNLEADDDTKYTTTTDVDGNQTRVYNGETLDVKELLLTLRTAASRIETLETAKANLEARLTALEGVSN